MSSRMYTQAEVESLMAQAWDRGDRAHFNSTPDPQADIRELLARFHNTWRIRKACCIDCGLPCKDFGLDLWIAGHVWKTINQTPDGPLCPNCTCERLKAAFPDAHGVLGRLSVSMEEIRGHANATEPPGADGSYGP